MKLRINTKTIAKLNPCKDRFDNWKKHYPKFNEGVLVFLNLDNITFSDKLWVTLRLIPRDLVETFAIDCAIKADAAAYAAYAAADAAADAAAYAAYAATYAAADAADAADAAAADAAYAATYAAADAAAARLKSQNDSLDALAYLIKNHKEGDFK